MDRNTLDAMLNEITRQAVLAENRGERWSTREWTRRVINALIQLGIAEGHAPCPNPEYSWGEWLYDVIWLQVDEDNIDRVLSVPLVAEVEWGNQDEIWSDFQKLLVARANVRVMIFNDYPGLLEGLRAHVVRVARNGDRYLLARYITAEKRFAVEAWCIKVPE